MQLRSRRRVAEPNLTLAEFATPSVFASSIPQELEGMETLLEEERNPFEMGDADALPAISSVSKRFLTPTSSLRKARKRPRSETNVPRAIPLVTQRFEQWASDDERDGDKTVFTLPEPRGASRDEQQSWAAQHLPRVLWFAVVDREVGYRNFSVSYPFGT